MAAPGKVVDASIQKLRENQRDMSRAHRATGNSCTTVDVIFTLVCPFEALHPV